MIRFSVSFGNSQKEVFINKKINFLKILPKFKKIFFESKVLEKSFRNFKNLWDKNKKWLLIVNDMDRSTPTAKVLDYVFPVLKDTKELNVIVASGSHRLPNEDELKVIFGKYYDFFKKKIIFHKAKDEESLRYLGKTKRGTEVFINKNIFEADKIFVIGSIEPHYFAGFTGGRKAFLPGVAGYKTIEMNHRLALEEGTLPLKLKDNPVHEDMEEVIKFFNRKNILSFQVIYISGRGIVDASCGDILDSFYSLIPKARDIFSYKMEKKADFVITCARPPLDRTLYQAHKAIENVIQGVKEGGIILLISFCEEGIGGKVFFEHLTSRTPDEILKEVKENFKLGYQKSGRFVRVLKKFKVYSVTNIDSNLLKKAGIVNFNNIQKAVDEILSKNKISDIVYVPYGTEVILN